jgi:hypothetical protein
LGNGLVTVLSYLCLTMTDKIAFAALHADQFDKNVW